MPWDSKSVISDTRPRFCRHGIWATGCGCGSGDPVAALGLDPPRSCGDRIAKFVDVWEPMCLFRLGWLANGLGEDGAQERVLVQGQACDMGELASLGR